MRNASALFRSVASMIALGVLLSGCGQTPSQQDSAAGPDSGAGSVPAVLGRTFPAAPAAPGEPVAAGSRDSSWLSAPADPAELPAGTVYRNPANGRHEVVVADVERTAVLIGDSQSEPVSSWPRQALASLGYKVHFCGLGGTGYVAANGKTGNYIDALERGDWLLPYGSPPLVVIEGGGNDASRGASNAQIEANAARIIAVLQKRYPGSRLAMIGTLARGANDGGGRRSEVDALLATVAARHSIPFVSVGDWLTRYDLAKSLADGVHMNSQGHQALGVLLAGKLKDLGLQAREPDPATAGATR